MEWANKIVLIKRFLFHIRITYKPWGNSLRNYGLILTTLSFNIITKHERVPSLK